MIDTQQQYINLNIRGEISIIVVQAHSGRKRDIVKKILRIRDIWLNLCITSSRDRSSKMAEDLKFNKALFEALNSDNLEYVFLAFAKKTHS